MESVYQSKKSYLGTCKPPMWKINWMQLTSRPEIPTLSIYLGSYNDPLSRHRNQFDRDFISDNRFLALLLMEFSTLRPRQNEQYFADDIFKRIFFNENVWNSIKTPLKFVPKGPIYKIPALVQIMTWRRSGNKPLSEPMTIILHICFNELRGHKGYILGLDYDWQKADAWFFRKRIWKSYQHSYLQHTVTVIPIVAVNCWYKYQH